MPKFAVTVEDAKYAVEAPDENTAWAWANQTHQQAAKPTKAPSAAAPARPVPTTGAVVQNAANSAIAGIPDALLNTPTNLWNLIKSVPSIARGESLPEQTPTPDLVNKAFRAAGFIKDEKAPVTGTQKVIDAIVQGGVGTAISPAAGVRQAVTNTAVGGLGGAASEGTRAVTGNDALAITAGMVTPAAVNAVGNRARAKVAQAEFERQQNEVADATHADARKAGYVFPPAETNPSFINKRLTSLAGKAATDQEAAARNQGVTSRLAAEELGLPPGTALTEGKLQQFRDAAAQPYRDVSALSSNAKTYLELLKEARFNANNYSKFFDRSGDPDALASAKSFTKKAEQLETKIEQIALKAGQPDLVDQLRAARREIAKSYDIERALNLGDAGVSAPKIGAAFDRGAPLSGNLETIAKTNQAFPNQTREGAKVPAAGVSKSEMIVGALLGGAGGALAGPVGMAAAALPLLSGPARSLILSEGYQNLMTPPNRNASRTNRVLAEIPNQSPGQQAIQALLLERALAERN